ncbi:MAG: NAD-dependent epimerase/dehydratase family protein [Flavobacteriaceae bacterium]|nr:NAD-dependent epimerase/dehydratase family protein [Flavobacteriaceae bacterium]
MLEILITGNRGFVGSHLINTLKYKYSNEFNIIDFEKNDFLDQKSLDKKIKKSKVIIHFAAMNRHRDENFLLKTNVDLSKKIIESIERVGFRGKLIFASSTQENLNNNYGISKKKSRKLFIKSSEKNNFIFTALIIPNVFGPFGKPNYNSFIPTFCHRIIQGEDVQIIENKPVKLIYVDSLINIIVKEIKTNSPNHYYEIKGDVDISVENVKAKLDHFKSHYLFNSSIPSFDTDFDLNLFNTFRSYIDYDLFFPVKYSRNSDDRGEFVEIIRSNSRGQYSYSTTKPNITRGNHFHTKKIERFSVIKGEAIIQLRKIGTNNTHEFKLNGNSPSFVDIPIWYTHNIKNIGTDDLITLFWINEPYDENNSDTYLEKV